ncbi:hypothetical protein Tco_0209761 [Tanacetum coccineum]
MRVLQFHNWISTVPLVNSGTRFDSRNLDGVIHYTFSSSKSLSKISTGSSTKSTLASNSNSHPKGTCSVDLPNTFLSSTRGTPTNTLILLNCNTSYQLLGVQNTLTYGIHPLLGFSPYPSKELRENTFSGLDNEDANKHTEKVLEIVDLFHIPNITVDELMLRVFLISLTGATSRWLRNEPTGSIKTWEDLKTKFLNKYFPPGRTANKMEEINNFQQEPDETLYQAWERFKELLMKCPQHYLTEMQEVILFYNGLDIPTWQILDSRGAIPTMTAADAKKAIQEMAEYSQKWHNGTSRGRSTETFNGLAAIQEQLNNLGREIKKEKGFRSLPSSTKTNPSDQVKSISTTIEADSHSIRQEEGNYGPKCAEAYGALHINNTIPRKEKDPGSFTLPCYINNVCFDNALVDNGISGYVVKYPKGIAKNVLVGIGKFTFLVDFIILDMPEDIKVPLILGRPFLSTARAKIDVYKRKITLRVREKRIVFSSVKPASSLIKRVYMLSLRERMELDFEASHMGETLVINSSLDPLNGDYIKLNDLNEPFELEKTQGDD